MNRRSKVAGIDAERLEARRLLSAAGPGSLDPTFGDHGVAIAIPFGPNAPGGERGSAAMTEAVLPNGDIVVGGWTETRASSYDDFALARFRPDGRIDKRFGNGTGIVVTDFGRNAIPTSLAILPNDDILMAGTLLDGAHGTADFAAARYFPSGKLDAHFGVHGLLTTDLGADEFGAALGLLPGGKFVIAGTSENLNHSDFAAIRYYANGTVDKTFGYFGKALTQFPDGLAAEANAMAVLPSGKLLLAGQVGNDFGVVRYDANGSLDKSFGKAGIVTTAFAGQGAYANAIALAPGGKFVLAGYVATGSPYGTANFGLARYNVNGSLDQSFGDEGTVITGFPGDASAGGGGGGIANAVTVAPDGKIVAAGISMTDGAGQASRFTVARYRQNGTLDAGFARGGIAITNIGADQTDQARAVEIEADGKIVAAGFADAGEGPAFGVVRYEG